MPEEKQAKEDKNIPPACVDCLRWEQFGRNCHYFWEGKKECSMYATTPEEL